jgi:hypothetical protein
MGSLDFQKFAEECLRLADQVQSWRKHGFGSPTTGAK